MQLKTRYEQLRQLASRHWGLLVIVALIGLSVYGFVNGLRAGQDPGHPEEPEAPVTTPVQPEAPATPHLQLTPEPTGEPGYEPAPEPEVEPAAGPVDPAGMVWPLLGTVVRGFGWTYSPTFADWRFHPGIDIGGSLGQPVRSALPGRVVAVERSDWHATVVVLEHGRNLRTVYGNLGGVGVSPGDVVDGGAVIAQLGQPGAGEVGDGGPRLHFEVYLDGEAADPLRFLK
ncbi:MAG: M23 family metallopeptidase [Bacillota bacterium]